MKMELANRHEMVPRVLKDLGGTPYAASSLKVLSGGTANFIYHATLKTSLDDGTKEVIIKHGEDYVANSPSFKLTLSRCRIEQQFLRALSQLPVVRRAGSADFEFVVETPKFYHFDEQNNTQVQGYLPTSKDLKTYALKTYSENTPDALKGQCFQLGKALGTWLRNFHSWAATQPELRSKVSGNKEMQQLKQMINFGWLLDRVDQFPSVLADARDIFNEVKDMAAAELEDESQLQVIHGDFWSGNVLLPDAPIQEGVAVPMFVVDWESAQVGVPSSDMGQMIAEMYELKLFKNITAGLWMAQGFAEACEMTEEVAFRTAIQVGTHLISFGTYVQGWGTPDQVEMVARTGKEFIVHAWRKDREWFETGDLACLFRHGERK